MWLTVAKSLASLEITKKVGADGKVVEPKVAFGSGVVSYAAPFEAQVGVRSERHEKLISSVDS